MGRERHTLSNASEFKKVFRAGRREVTANLIVHSMDRGDNLPGRSGLVVSKKVGGAVDRNRTRRRLRAAIEAAGGIAPGVDAVIVAKAGRRPGVAEMTAEIAGAMHGWQTMVGREEARE